MQKTKEKEKSSSWRWKRQRLAVSCYPLFTCNVNNGECRRRRRRRRGRVVASGGNNGGRWWAEGFALHCALLCYVSVLLLRTVKNAEDEGEGEGAVVGGENGGGWWWGALHCSHATWIVENAEDEGEGEGEGEGLTVERAEANGELRELLSTVLYCALLLFFFFWQWRMQKTEGKRKSSGWR